MIQSLGEGLHGVNRFSGATILGDGSVSLILDLSALVSESRFAEQSARFTPTPGGRAENYPMRLTLRRQITTALVLFGLVPAAIVAAFAWLSNDDYREKQKIILKQAAQYANALLIPHLTKKFEEPSFDKANWIPQGEDRTIIHQVLRETVDGSNLKLDPDHARQSLEQDYREDERDRHFRQHPAARLAGPRRGPAIRRPGEKDDRADRLR